MLAKELDDGAQGDARAKTFVAGLAQRLASGERNDESQARALTRDLVLALQATLLLRHAPAEVAEAFCASRLGGESDVFGTLPAGTDTRAIVERAAPVR
jgi:putative acyl-CoA dehydrogenase